MSHDVFISYSSLDKAAADATCAALEGSGIRCWIAPRDIIPGKEWGDAIIEAIHSARVLVLIFSANANTSHQIRREVERAVHKGIPIIPLRIEDIAPTHSLEYFIGTVHWLDALTPPFEGHLRRLSDSVRALLQIDPDRPSIVAPAVVAAPANRSAFVRNLCSGRADIDRGRGRRGDVHLVTAPARTAGASAASVSRRAQNLRQSSRRPPSKRPGPSLRRKRPRRRPLWRPKASGRSSSGRNVGAPGRRQWLFRTLYLFDRAERNL